MFAPQGYPPMTPQDMIDYAGQAGMPQPPIQSPEIVDVRPIIGMAGAEKNPIDWKGKLATFGSYLNAIGSGINPNASSFATGLAGSGDTLAKHQQNIQNFKTMSPYYQQMGYDVTKLDPRRGGGGVGSTPESLINLQSQVDRRAMNNLYRQQMIEASKAKQDSVTTISDLMMINPQFKQQMQGQYNFTNGQNASVLKTPLPAEFLKNYLPKNVNMNYAGGLNSTKTSKATITHSSGGGGGGKSSNKKSKPKLIF